jgi:hypothetical protein
VDHGDLVVKFAQALAEIGDALKETKLSAELYQTEMMKEAIAHLYAHIILFLQQAIKWYNMGPAGRFISSVFKPYNLDYKETVEQIKLYAETVDGIATAASRAEIRDIHIIIQMREEERQRRDAKLHEMQLELREMQLKIDQSVRKVLQTAISE